MHAGISMELWLRSMPRRAALVALGVGAIGMASRNAWPTLAETFILATSVVCIYGVLQLKLEPIRIALAGLWVAVVASVGDRMSVPQIWLDFKTFVDGANLLFDHHLSPYLAIGTTAFPFPTFLLVRALSLGGYLPFDTIACIFFLLQVLFLALSYLLVRRVIRQERLRSMSDVAIGVIQGGLILHPAVYFGLLYGQSGVIAGAALVGAIWCWRCGNDRCWWHGAAILLNLAWMIKPQLLMAAGFFLASWLRERKLIPRGGMSDAAIGRLFLPWSAALIALSLPIGFPASLMAYDDFFGVALRWHTYVAESLPNNYAPSAILAKAGMRIWGISVSQSLPILSTAGASLVLLWNWLSLARAEPNSLRTFVPWLLASLLWTSLVWPFYLSLVIGGLLLLVAYEKDPPGSPSPGRSLWLAIGIGLTMVFSSFTFTFGILILYFQSHELLAEEMAAFHLEGGWKRTPS